MHGDPHHDPEEAEEARQSGGSLIALVLGPTVWAFHFLAVYVAGAVACERAPDAMETVRFGIYLGTGLALVAIVVLTLPAWREWRSAGDIRPESGSRRARASFLGYAALLLSGLSFIAVIFSALPAALAGTCT